MAVYGGKNAYVLVGKEGPWGVPVACTKDVGLVQNITINDANTLRAVHSISTIETQKIVAGKYTVGGSIEVIYQHGRLLEYLTGGITTHNAVNAPDIKHDYVIADTLQSFTLEDGYNGAADAVQTYAGCKVTSGTLALSLDGSLTVRVDFVGKTVADTLIGALPVISTLEQLPDYWFSISTGASGAEVLVNNVQGFEVTVNNIAGGDPAIWGLGSRLPTDLQANQRTWDFRFTVAFADQTEYERFLGGAAPDQTDTPTLPSLVINGTNGVGLGAGRRQIFIQLDNCSYDTISKPTNVGGFIIADFSGKSTGYTAGNFYTYDSITAVNW